MNKIILFSVFCFSLYHMEAQTITTFAGIGPTFPLSGGYSGDGGQATNAELQNPTDIAFGTSGIVYIADCGNNRIRKVNSSGTISTYAGNGIMGYSGDGGPATAAEFWGPFGIITDASGHLYIADEINNRIRKVTSSGKIITIAGNGAFGFSGDGGQATTAELASPGTIAFDIHGNLYIADGANQRIRMVSTSGIITTVAGNGINGYSGDGGPATASELYDPAGVAVDASGNMYIADMVNGCIRKVTTSGIISTYAGNGITSYSGDGGPATAAELNSPKCLLVDPSGNLYISDYSNYRVREVNTSGIIYTIAGDSAGFSGDGGPATAAELYGPDGVALDSQGTLYIADVNNNRVRSFYLLGTTISVIANEACYGNTTGSAMANPSGGASPYTYSWTPTGGTGATATGLSAGTYTVIVTDNNNHSTTTTVTITQPTALTDSIRILASDICVCKKTLIAFPLRGTSPYTYLWSNGVTKDTNLDITGGLTHSITITDSNGCSHMDSVTVPNQTFIVTTSQTNIPCGGSGYGSASVTSPLGFPYSYTWSPGGQTTASITGLSAGTYQVTVVDAIPSCTVTANVTITQPQQLLVNATTFQRNCSFYPNLTANVTGGTSPYTYLWSDNETNSLITPFLGCPNFSSPLYITVTDANNCTANSLAYFEVPVQIANWTQTNVTCYGGNNGSIYIPVCGDAYQFYYTITPGGTFSSLLDYYTFSNLTSGTYTISVTDSYGCNTGNPLIITITQPTQIIVSTNTTNVNCFGGNSGGASSTISGGASPYTYLWSNSQSTTSISGLSMGTYTLNVTDSNGCTGSAIAAITQPTQLNVSATTLNNISCFGGNNGSASSTISGGTLPYTYSWSNSQTATSISGLSAGTYTVTVQDNNGCASTDTITITQPAQLSILADSIADNGTCNGSAWVSLSGGSPNYTYKWTGRPTTTDSIFNTCHDSIYCCTVTDINGCKDSVCITIPLHLSTGLNIAQNQSYTNLYPNPNNGVFTIRLSHPQFVSGQETNIEIYNVFGEKVTVATLNQVQGNNLINLTEQPNGVYLYRVINEYGNLLGEGKFVIDK
ncbi:MAG TPA: T9SS type A sorting domain-containing protein [Bacteroidia bacterium]|jgi:hypothetical protein|nr:T9SS type A sorting domain-containing protein [Bacteroidia bacterium]